MRKAILHILLCLALLGTMSACRSEAPHRDYRALARASIRLGTDIDLADNHKLYIHAADWIGTPYHAGGTTKRGVDCSGLVAQLYKEVFHIRLSRNTRGLQDDTRKVSRNNLREGDLVFFTTPSSGKKVGHVGIYLKEGKFIHASTGRGVIVSSLREPYYEQHWHSAGRVNRN